MRAVWGVWRWRRNPLRRATDRREAWLALAALLLVVLVAPALGWVCGALTDDALQESVRAQRAQRHPTTAVVVRRAAGPPRLAGEQEGSSGRAAHTTVVAKWRAPDGRPRRGTVSTASKVGGPGSRVRIWTDAAGRPAPRPMDVPTAHTHAVLAGVGVFLLVSGFIEVCRRLIVWRMAHRRYALLDRAWARAGPDWGRAGTGN
ncbi:hypothetical protein [Streptomyces sp. BE147]|uniref:Rv1733c family protein n=1 Tax=unclassified Streptomyces TaxID=2593676 RepID=UPI002E7A39CF|nr:hypothetical protein [Streptomyces sp. BE147]MEE1740566.1 hypothetical protein [Streptomyces sp. BE147]